MAEQLIDRSRLPETPMMRKLREEGREDVLLRLLVRRFGVVDAALEQQIRALDGAQLLALTDVFLDLASLAEVQQWLAAQTSDGVLQ